MARFFTYTIVMVGLAVLFSITGLNTMMTTTISWISALITNGSITSSGIYLLIYGGLTALIITGSVSLGFVTFSKTDLATTAGIAVAMIAIVIDSMSIISYVNGISAGSWIYYLTLLIMIPLIVGYIISLYDWTRGVYS